MMSHKAFKYKDPRSGSALPVLISTHFLNPLRPKAGTLPSACVELSVHLTDVRRIVV